MKTRSIDLREQVCRARDAGMPRTEVARLFGVSASSVSRWHRDWQAGRALAPKPRPGRTPRIGRADQPALAALVAADPDATLAMHCATWEATHGVAVSEATMCRALRRAQLTLKKTTVARERDEAARTAWRATVAVLDPGDLIFFDETSTPLTLTPLRARSRRGERAVDLVPRGRWHSVTLLATLTPTGMGPCALLPGATDRLAFEAFVDQLLIPALRPGQTVVLDNLAVHKSARVRERLTAAGCDLRFLPTYSPDFNPIEQAFAKLKTQLRRAEARSADDLLSATAAGIAAITAQDAAAFFAEAGFPLTDQLL